MIMNTAKRNTVQRALVLDAVRSLHCHPTSAEVYEQVRTLHPSISRATVYRNLAVLAESGDIAHIEMPGAADRYDFRLDVHSYAVCECCGRVFDVELVEGSTAIDLVSDSHGFEIGSHSLVFSGVCAECRVR